MYANYMCEIKGQIGIMYLTQAKSEIVYMLRHSYDNVNTKSGGGICRRTCTLDRQ